MPGPQQLTPFGEVMGPSTGGALVGDSPHWGLPLGLLSLAQSLAQSPSPFPVCGLNTIASPIFLLSCSPLHEQQEQATRTLSPQLAI